MSAVLDRLILDYSAAKTAFLEDLLTQQHRYMDIVLGLAEIQLDRHREYYSITRFFLQNEEYGVKWLYCKTPASNEKIYGVDCQSPTSINAYTRSPKLSSFYNRLKMYAPERISVYISSLEKKGDSINTIISGFATEFLNLIRWAGHPDIRGDISSEDFISGLDDLNLYAEFFEYLKKGTGLEHSQILDVDSEINNLVRKGDTLETLCPNFRNIIKPFVRIDFVNANRLEVCAVNPIFLSGDVFQNLEEKVRSGMNRNDARTECYLDFLKFIKNITKRVRISLNIKSEKDIEVLKLNDFHFIEDLQLKFHQR